MKVLLVSATYDEIKLFVERLENKVVQNNLYSGTLNETDFDCLIAGIGATATTFSLTKQLQNNKYDFIINAGIAGSYSDNLRIGQVVTVVSDCFADFGVDDNGLFRTAFEEKFLSPNTFPYKDAWLVNTFTRDMFNNLTDVKGITVNTATGSKEKIKFLKIKFDPEIETMEGAAFMYTCLMQLTNFVQIRAISNKVEQRNKKNWNISLAIKNLTSTLIDIFTSSKF